ncbi:CCAAT/enhancer-binding protein zeta-like isoform X2 [Hydractinia symbiolongicarpus]|uniref:CCAAT/enhancer-binding protein zeta-like isoform X2 n=1 Tax=Hydractinia symbiolongicarpus TaxID=13093 RepID=UPI0025517B25|nr:CCAAT/enhancer-binding protein zeta-like isoform X2 [Hydractinia symbiolongicarpus]
MVDPGSKTTSRLTKTRAKANTSRSKKTKKLAASNIDTRVEKTYEKDYLFTLEEVLSFGGDKLQSYINNLGLDILEVKQEAPTASQGDLPKKKSAEKKEDVKTEKIKQEVAEDINFKAFLSSLSNFKHDKCLLKNCVPWYNQVAHLQKSHSSFNPQEIKDVQSLAMKYWQNDVEMYQMAKEADKSSDTHWLRTVLKSGTQSDKVASLTMLTQESPIHCMRSLEALMNMAKKKSRREALIAVDALRHLWISDILPERKLRVFEQNPFQSLKQLCNDGRKDSQIKLLMTMAFEHQLKSTYLQYIEIIQNLSKDPLVNIRNKVLGIIYELLVLKPEQEQKLLAMLVNKLGDPDKKVASKSSYLMSQLILKHPNMKNTVIQEVERMMFRPNVSEKSQYYAICFLNQIALSHQEKNVATKLISIYFSFFKVTATRYKNKKSVDAQQTKLLSGLLTGVNRAFPYAQGEDGEYDEKLNTLFRLTHIDHLGTSIQAFMLIYQVMESRQSVSDRYYQALYEKLLDPEIKNSSRHTMLLNLLFKSMKNDPALKRVKSFIKRLLQLCSQEQPSFSCGVLFLLSEIIKVKPGIKTMMQQIEDEDGEEHFKDVVASDCEVGIENDSQENDDVIREDTTGEETKPTRPSWTFINKDTKNETYDINHRNPLYAGAEFSSVWEAIPLLKHFHPSVQHFSSSVLQGEIIEYKGDPLQDFTMIRFLDRFMYRNPKKKEVEHGTSLMQPKELSSRLKEEPVNSKVFLQKSKDKIRQDELFFYLYFKQTEKSDKKLKTEKSDGDEEVLSEENIFDVDFASEMKKNKNKTSKNEDTGESESSEDEFGRDELFDYDNMGEESDEDFDGTPAHKDKKFADKDYEDALFENLNSDGESIDGDDSEGAKIECNMDSMFATADEFAHLLEDDEREKNSSGVHPKQQEWEQRHDKKNWRRGKRKKFSGKLQVKGQQYNERRKVKKT